MSETSNRSQRTGGEPGGGSAKAQPGSRPDPTQPLRSATPSKATQALAFAGIVVAGICGGLAGYAFGDLQCGEQGCPLEAALWGLGGALLAASGVGVVATLTLRAMTEWQAKPPENNG